MNNSSLVNNTDRIYGETDPLQKNANQGYVDTESECSVWVKVLALLFMTYGLIIAFFQISKAIEDNKGGVTSFQEGGAIMLSLFLAYIAIIGFMWYNGASKRDELIREVVEEQLRREREE